MTADSQPTPAASSLIDFLTRQFVPALLVGWLLLSVMACPLQFLVIREFATRAAYRAGATQMCQAFSTDPAQTAQLCAELASELSTARDEAAP